jgi:hypothetical protein
VQMRPSLRSSPDAPTSAASQARWAGQLSLCAYASLALQLRGARALPLEWQLSLEEPRLLIKPDAPAFTQLARPQQAELLRRALMRPHLAVANVPTYARPPVTAKSGTGLRDAAEQRPGLGARGSESGWLAGHLRRLGCCPGAAYGHRPLEACEGEAPASACLLLTSKASVSGSAAHVELRARSRRPSPARALGEAALV